MWYTASSLGAVPAVIELSRRARRCVIANLIIAASSITVLVLWDLFGTLPLPLGWPATKAPPSSSDSVGLNGLRLLRESAWRKNVNFCRAGVEISSPRSTWR